MTFWKPSYESIWPLAINRAHFEANNSYVSFALTRLSELAEEFPNDSHVAYAEGMIRRDFVGKGAEARVLFEKAFQLSTTTQLAETRWFALCNLIGLAENEKKYRLWVEVAFKEQGKKGYEKALKALDKGHDYATKLMDESLVHYNNREFGLAAAIVEVALGLRSEGFNELSARHNRALFLRAVDNEVQRKRNARGEMLASDERFALHEAMKEINKCVALDPYDATFWNYKSAWSLLLEDYADSVSSAEKAMKLRPSNYPRPHINKANALLLLNRKTEALASASEAFNQAKACHSTEDAERASWLIEASCKGSDDPTLSQMLPVIVRVIEVALQSSSEEFNQLKNGATVSTTVDTLRSKILQARGRQMDEFVPIMRELLSDFSPESALSLSLLIAQDDQGAVEYLLLSALYLAVNSKGVLQRDCARYLSLMTLVLREASDIRAYYRSAILEPSAADKKLTKLDSIIRKELAYINPLFPKLIAEQEPVDREGLARAMRNIISHLPNYECV
jgi:tetratricopeptide (TPR) repeat protein